MRSTCASELSILMASRRRARSVLPRRERSYDLTAASNALALCCANKEANRELSASRYASLASVLVDRDDVVRNEFARKLSQAVSSGQASFAKWAGALVLVALAPATGSEEKEEKRKAVAMASRALRVAVARQRRSHAQAIRRLPPGAGTNEVDRLATRYLPVAGLRPTLRGAQHLGVARESRRGYALTGRISHRRQGLARVARRRRCCYCWSR